MPDLVTHNFKPIYNKDSRILILGTMPSVKSRENNFYYMHPQNRFWKLLAALLAWEFPTSMDEKVEMLLKNRIAVWDVLASCEIQGSADSSIKHPVANDLFALLNQADIRAIFVNGRKADELYRRHMQPTCGREAIYLPSTSPANASFSLERLQQEWGRIKDFL